MRHLLSLGMRGYKRPIPFVQSLQSFHSSAPLRRTFQPIRSEDEFTSYLSLSTANWSPLITLWTASWCSTCHAVAPLLERLIDERDDGKGGILNFVQIPVDVPDTQVLRERYYITAVPTIMAFHRNEPMHKRLAGTSDVKDRQALEKWLDEMVVLSKERKSGWWV